MSTSLSSSLDMLSLSHTSSTRWASDSTSDDEAEDEIVWSLSSSAVLSSSSNSPLSETADFVLIPRIETSAPNALATAATTATATSQEAPVSPPSESALTLTPDGIPQDLAAVLSLSTAARTVHASSSSSSSTSSASSGSVSAAVVAPPTRQPR